MLEANQSSDRSTRPVLTLNNMMQCYEDRCGIGGNVLRAVLDETAEEEGREVAGRLDVLERSAHQMEDARDRWQREGHGHQRREALDNELVAIDVQRIVKDVGGARDLVHFDRILGGELGARRGTQNQRKACEPIERHRHECRMLEWMEQEVGLEERAESAEMLRQERIGDAIATAVAAHVRHEPRDAIEPHASSSSSIRDLGVAVLGGGRRRCRG